jgi:LPXTG-site transpeptidase (sortase) family protein
MEGQFNFFKYLLAATGCIVIFSLPVVGILAIWGFDSTNIKESLSSFFVAQTPPTQEEDYNFEIPAGEDALLTSNIKSESREIVISPRTNPAVLVSINATQIQGPIVYGQDGEELLKKGFWHYPGSVYPGEQGVSVIFGHRRYHLPPASDTFYNLDKVNVGNRVEIQLQDGTWLEYTVVNVEVINPEDLYSVVTAQSNEYLVKFITCTPLGTDKQRLIVTAEKTF